MALFVIQHVLVDNIPGSAGLLAGMAVHLTTASGVETVVAANRATTTHRFYGILGDDTTNTGNTMSVIDPVSPNNYSHDTTTGLSPGDYEGADAVARPARRLGDLLDERITNTKNWTDTGGTASRPVTVYRTGGRFRTDQYATVITTAATTDAGAAATLGVGSKLTFGAGANAGLWIEIDPTAVGIDDINTGVIAIVTKPAAIGGMIEIALTGAHIA